MGEKIAPPRPLTLAFVRHVTAPGRYTDQDGLMLQVSAGGAKSWVQRITIQGRRQDIGLGSARVITPAEARRMAARNREIARSGGNPLAPRPDRRRTDRTAPREVSVSRFALTRYQRQVAAGGNLAAIRRERALLLRMVTPLIGRIPVARVIPGDVQGVLDAAAATGPAAAEAIRRQLAALFDEAVEQGLRPDNPARSGQVSTPRRPIRITAEGDDRNRRILSELPGFFARIRTSAQRPSLMCLLQFTLLTLRNPQECRLATWEQISLDRGLWRFPLMQRDDGELFEVGIHPGIRAVLDRARVLRGEGMTGWLFPNPYDPTKPYTENAAYKAREVHGYDIATLDFRRAHEFWAHGREDGGDLEAWSRFLIGT